MRGVCGRSSSSAKIFSTTRISRAGWPNTPWRESSPARPWSKSGPGLGALTAVLLEKDLQLIALEKDRGLCAFLREKFAAEIARGKLDLREGDALEVLPVLGATPAVICGNLPYYISTPLLMECARLSGPPARLFFLMQKEVGQRLGSLPGNKTYGALSVLVQSGYEVALVRTLSGSVFYPPPEVESVAVQLTPRAQPLVAPADRERFAAVVQRGFSQRRKKLSNLLPTRDGRRAEHLSPPNGSSSGGRLRLRRLKPAAPRLISASPPCSKANTPQRHL